jgi:hypothetical protein
MLHLLIPSSVSCIMCIQSLNGVTEVTAHNRPSDIHIITHKGSSINFITDVQLISKAKKCQTTVTTQWIPACWKRN